MTPRAPRRLPALRRFRGPDAQLERMGRDLRPGRAPDADCRDRPVGLLHARGSSSRRPAPASPIHSEVPVAEHRGQRHDPLEELDVQRRRCSPATTRCTARGCARTRPTLSGFVAGAREQVQDVRDPVQQDDPAASRRDLGLQRQRHGLRELRASTTRRPARCRAPRRGIAT